MILSHRFRFIFVRTTKVAGTSLEIALSKYSGPEDVLTDIASADEAIRQSLGFPGEQNNLKPFHRLSPGEWLRLLRTGRRPKAFFGHMPAVDIRAAVGERTWNGYFKFSVVRNPFDYAVSRYFWSHRNDSPSKEGFRRYLLSDQPKRLWKNRGLTHIDGRNVMDFMIRYENMADDLATLGRRLEISDDIFGVFRSVRAKSNVRPSDTPVAEMYAGFPEGIARIAAEFAEDIETYGYRAPGA